MTAPRLVLVLGMHCGGTSITTRALAAMGVDLGGNLMQQARRNPDGLLEDTAIVGINEALLASSGLKWHSLKEVAPVRLDEADSLPLRQQARQLLESSMALYRPFGFKDPRTSRLLPFWRSTIDEITGDAGCIVVARNPMAVAQSLSRRNRFTLEHGLELWHLHMKPLVGSIDGTWKKVVVEYDRLVDEPESQLRRIAAAMNLDTPSTPAVAEFCERFPDRTRRHSTAGSVDKWPVHILDTWNELRRLSGVDKVLGDER